MSKNFSFVLKLNEILCMINKLKISEYSFMALASNSLVQNRQISNIRINSMYEIVEYSEV